MDPATGQQMAAVQAGAGVVNRIASSDAAKVGAPSMIIILLAINTWSIQGMGAEVSDNTVWRAERVATLKADAKHSESQQAQYTQARTDHRDREAAKDAAYSADRKTWQTGQTKLLGALTSLVTAVDRLGARDPPRRRR